MTKPPTPKEIRSEDKRMSVSGCKFYKGDHIHLLTSDGTVRLEWCEITSRKVRYLNE